MHTSYYKQTVPLSPLSSLHASHCKCIPISSQTKKNVISNSKYSQNHVTDIWQVTKEVILSPCNPPTTEVTHLELLILKTMLEYETWQTPDNGFQSYWNTDRQHKHMKICFLRKRSLKNVVLFLFFLSQIWNHSWHFNFHWIFYLTQVSQPVSMRGIKKTIFTVRWSNTGTGEPPPFDRSGTWQDQALRNLLELQLGVSSSWMELAGGEAEGLLLTAFRGPSPSACCYGSTTEACLHVWQELSISKESWLLWQRSWVGKYFTFVGKWKKG